MGVPGTGHWLLRERDVGGFSRLIPILEVSLKDGGESFTGFIVKSMDFSDSSVWSICKVLILTKIFLVKPSTISTLIKLGNLLETETAFSLPSVMEFSGQQLPRIQMAFPGLPCS